MMFLLFLLNSLFAVELKEVHRHVNENLPLIEAQLQKVSESEGKLRSADGAFDTTLKAKSESLNGEVYDYSFWDARLEKQTSLLGSKLYVGQRAGTGMIPSYKGEKKTSSEGEIFAGISLPILRDLWTDKYRTELKNAKLAVLVEKQILKQKRIEYLLKSSKAYWDWVAYGQSLRVQEELVEVAEKRADFLRRKLKAGDIERLQLSDNLRTLSKRRALYLEAKANWLSAVENLKVYYPFAKIAELTQVPEQKYVKDYKTCHKYSYFENYKEELPLFKTLKLRQEMAKNNVRLAKNQVFPKLNLNVEGVRDIDANVRGIDREEVRVGVMFEYPLANNKTQGKKTQAIAQKEVVRYELAWFEQIWMRNVKSFLAQYSSYREMLKNQKIQLDNTQKMADAEVIKLRRGGSNIFFVNIREQDLAEAKLSLIKTFAKLNFLSAQEQGLDLSILAK